MWSLRGIVGCVRRVPACHAAPPGLRASCSMLSYRQHSFRRASSVGRIRTRRSIAAAAAAATSNGASRAPGAGGGDSQRRSSSRPRSRASQQRLTTSRSGLCTCALVQSAACGSCSECAILYHAQWLAKRSSRATTRSPPQFACPWLSWARRHRCVSPQRLKFLHSTEQAAAPRSWGSGRCPLPSLVKQATHKGALQSPIAAARRVPLHLGPTTLAGAHAVAFYRCLRCCGRLTLVAASQGARCGR